MWITTKLFFFSLYHIIIIYTVYYRQQQQDDVIIAALSIRSCLMISSPRQQMLVCFLVGFDQTQKKKASSPSPSPSSSLSPVTLPSPPHTGKAAGCPWWIWGDIQVILGVYSSVYLPVGRRSSCLSALSAGCIPGESVWWIRCYMCLRHEQTAVVQSLTGPHVYCCCVVAPTVNRWSVCLGAAESGFFSVLLWMIVSPLFVWGSYM